MQYLYYFVLSGVLAVQAATPDLVLEPGVNPVAVINAAQNLDFVPPERMCPLAVTLHVCRGDFNDRDLALPLAKKAGIAMIRGGLRLSQVMTDEGWDFSRGDAVLASCEKAGVEWLPILIHPHAKPAAHEDLPLWREYVRRMVTRYKGRIKTWEVWNEQNISGFWANPNPTNYTVLLKATYEEIKASDPTARVAIGGYSGVPFEYLEEVYKLGGGSFFDIMNVHPYCYPGNPEGYFELHVDRLQKIMTQYGDGKKPIWFTEVGWPTQEIKIRAKGVLVAALEKIEPGKKDWRVIYCDAPSDGTWVECLNAELPGVVAKEVPFKGLPAYLDRETPDVIVFPYTGGYERDALDAVEKKHLTRGGILACLSGVPLHFSCMTDADGNLMRDSDNAGFKARPRLKIAMSSKHTDKQISKALILENGVTAQRFFGEKLLGANDVFLPLEGWTAKTNEFELAAAGIYRYDGGKKGSIIVSGVMESSSSASTEERQAELLPRSIATALHLGIERYFVYEFRASEKDVSDPESHFGIVHADLSAKPAYEALKTFHYFRPDGSSQTPSTWRTSGGTYSLQWLTPGGRPSGILWNPSAPGVKQLKFSSGDAQFFDLYGKPIDVQPDANGGISLSLSSKSVYYVDATFTGEYEDKR